MMMCLHKGLEGRGCGLFQGSVSASIWEHRI